MSRVDHGEDLGKLRYLDEALRFLDKVEFSPGSLECYFEPEWDWILGRRGTIHLPLSGIEWGDSTLVQTPLKRNAFPFVIELDEYLAEEQDDDYELPGPFQNAEELEAYITENLEVEEQYEYLATYDLKLTSPELGEDSEMDIKMFDQDAHMGLDALLRFLAGACAVNRDGHEWHLVRLLIGEDGRQFASAEKIVEGEVKDPFERDSLW